MTSLHIENKIATQFFSGPTFKSNNERLNYNFEISRLQMSKTHVVRQHYDLKQTKIEFKGNFIYHNPLLSWDSKHITTYDENFRSG